MLASSITKNRILLFPANSNKKMKLNPGWTQMNQINYSITIYYLFVSVLICCSTKIPGGVKNIGDLCFQLKKPLFHRSQRHAEPEVVAEIVVRVLVDPDR